MAQTSRILSHSQFGADKVIDGDSGQPIDAIGIVRTVTQAVEIALRFCQSPRGMLITNTSLQRAADVPAPTNSSLPTTLLIETHCDEDILAMQTRFLTTFPISISLHHDLKPFAEVSQDDPYVIRVQGKVSAMAMMVILTNSAHSRSGDLRRCTRHRLTSISPPYSIDSCYTVPRITACNEADIRKLSRSIMC